MFSDVVIEQGDYAKYSLDDLYNALHTDTDIDSILAVIEQRLQSLNVVKHLAGQHDQSTHGHGHKIEGVKFTGKEQRFSFDKTRQDMNALGVSNEDMAKWATKNRPEQWEKIKNDPEQIKKMAEQSCVMMQLNWGMDPNLPMCLAMKERAKIIFGLNDAGFSGLENPKINQYPEFAQSFIEDPKVVDAFLQVTYNQTQQFLADNGIKELTVYRGTQQSLPSFGVDSYKNSMIMRTQTAPLSSWTVSKTVAKQFSVMDSRANSVILTKTVPAKQVLGLGLINLGAWNEQEVVLLGDTNDTKIIGVDA